MKLRNIMGALALCLGLTAVNAHADLLDPTKVENGGASNPDAEIAILEVLFPSAPTPIYLGKQDGENWSPDSLLPREPYFTIDRTGGTAEVSWNLTGSGYLLGYVVVKSAGAWNIYPVDAVLHDQRLIGGPHSVDSDNYNENDRLRDISHISFYGWQGTPGVPDGGLTALLLGLGLAGLGASRRLLRK